MIQREFVNFLLRRRIHGHIGRRAARGEELPRSHLPARVRCTARHRRSYSHGPTKSGRGRQLRRRALASEWILGRDFAHDIAHELVGFVLDRMEAPTRLVLLRYAAVGGGTGPRLELFGLKRCAGTSEVARAVLM